MAPRTVEHRKIIGEKYGIARKAADAILKPGLHKDFDPKKVRAILLVGSVAKGTAIEKKSDVDLLVLTDGHSIAGYKELRPLLQHIADSSESVPYICPIVVDIASFRKSIKQPMANRRIMLARLNEFKDKAFWKLTGVNSAYPVVQRVFEAVSKQRVEDFHTEMHSGMEQMMSAVLYESEPGSTKRMFDDAGLRPKGIYQLDGFGKILDSYLDGGIGKKEVRRILRDEAPFLWQHHLKHVIGTYESAEHRKRLKGLL